MHPAGVPVVGDVHPVAGQGQVLEEEREHRHQPGDAADEDQAEQPDDGPGPGLFGHGVQRDKQGDEDEGEAGRASAALGQVGGGCRTAPDPAGCPVDDQRNRVAEHGGHGQHDQHGGCRISLG